MGGAIAAHLVQAGHPVYGFDPDPEAVNGRARERLAEQAIALLDAPICGFRLWCPLTAGGSYVPATMKPDMWQEDMALIEAFAREHGVRTPLFDAAQPVYAAAHDVRPHADTAAVSEALRAAAAMPEAT